MSRQQYRAQLHAVERADRLALRVDLGLGIACRLSVQLTGIMAPERGTAAGEQAAWWIREALRDAEIIVELPGAKVGHRWCGRVWLGELDGPRVEPDIAGVLLMLDLVSPDVPASVREAMRR
jgi:hypothetical protein